MLKEHFLELKEFIVKNNYTKCAFTDSLEWMIKKGFSETTKSHLLSWLKNNVGHQHVFIDDPKLADHIYKKDK